MSEKVGGIGSVSGTAAVPRGAPAASAGQGGEDVPSFVQMLQAVFGGAGTAATSQQAGGELAGFGDDEGRDLGDDVPPDTDGSPDAGNEQPSVALQTPVAALAMLPLPIVPQMALDVDPVTPGGSVELGEVAPVGLVQGGPRAPTSSDSETPQAAAPRAEQQSPLPELVAADEIVAVETNSKKPTESPQAEKPPSTDDFHVAIPPIHREGRPTPPSNRQSTGIANGDNVILARPVDGDWRPARPLDTAQNRPVETPQAPPQPQPAREPASNTPALQVTSPAFAQIEGGIADQDRDVPPVDRSGDSRPVEVTTAALQGPPAASGAENAAPGHEAARVRSPETPMPADLVNQIVRHIELRRAEGRSEMTVRLEPPDLGELRIRLATDGGGLSTELAARNDAVRSFVQAHIADIRQALTDAGIEVAWFAVAVGPDFDLSRNGGQEPGRQRRRTSPVADAAPSLGAAEVSSSSPTSLFDRFA